MGTPPPIMMANLGMADTLILMVLALVVFGPRRLPQIGRQIGKLMYEFRKASNDFKFQMEEELRQSEEADRRQKEEAERQKALAANTPAPQLDAPAPQIDQPAGSIAESVTPALPEIPTESSYPGETSYSDMGTEGTRTEKATAAAIEDPWSEDEGARPDEAARLEDLKAPVVEVTHPRIQPPSTGEVVPANPPGHAPQQAELFESNMERSAEPAAEPEVPSPVDAEATAPESTTPDTANSTHRSEPAAHHG